MWIAAIFFAYLALIFFVAALSPQHPMRWGKYQEGPPMSVAGRVLLGVWTSYIAVGIALMAADLFDPRTSYIAMGSYVGFIIAMMALWWRDARKQRSRDETQDDPAKRDKE